MAARSQHERFRFSDYAALADCARELGVEVPFQEDPRVLFSPLEIAGRRLANRFVVQPMEGCDAEPDGAPGPLALRRYRRYAAGGSTLIWFEATAVTPEGRANPRQLRLTPANVAAFRQLTDETRASASGHHDLMLILQLTHSGRFARPCGTPQPVIAQHNPLLDARQGLSPEHPLVRDDELDRLRDSFVRAAELAATAGFDGVDVKACNGYLVSELLASFTRTDSRYGGSFENRTRFLLETVAQIRASVPALIVTSRFSVHDGLPHPYGFGADAETWAEPIELARRLRELGCPLLSVSLGIPYYNPHVGRPYDQPVAGGGVPDEHPLIGVARQLRAAAAIQKAVPDVPVVGAGYSWLRHLFPRVAASAIARGEAALIGLGRMALAYPDCVNDLAASGKLDRNKACSACSGCSQIMRDGGHVGCRVRDCGIYAEEYRQGRTRASQTAPKGGPR